MSEPAYAWAGDLESFVAEPVESLLGALTRFTRETGGPQLFAWHNSIAVFKDQLRTCLPNGAGMGLVLEFQLPNTGGRRPDLILLENGTVVVVEFKNRVAAEQADVDQVRRYVRDLADYHSACHDRQLVPLLVPMGMSGPAFEWDGVFVMPPSALGTRIRSLATARRHPKADVAAFTSAPYCPLPSLVEAARLLFHRLPLPRIRRAESARVPETVRLIESVIGEAVSTGRHTLVLLAGVPGSGKSLVGLQLVHSGALSVPAVFVSGNGPLVQVLQYALGGGQARREFVRDLRAFKIDNLVRSNAPPRERVIVFDEAQRAWDSNRVLLKSQGRLVGSEPELFARLAARVPGEPFVLVALIGEGQEIHVGEEQGLRLWVDAVKGSENWNVVAPEHLAKAFRSAGVPTRVEPRLTLTASLRSHRAAESSRWVEELLAGRLVDAARTSEGLHRDGFEIVISRNLEALRTYVRDLYAEDPARRFGLLASSRFRKLDAFGARPLRADYYYYGEWYEEGRTHPKSGAQLETALTEFGCQGLELDLPVLCWGPDLTWSGGGWVARVRKSKDVENPSRLRFNAYRVLLTRGRDGLALFVPQDSSGTWDETYEALVKAGSRPLGT